MMQPPMENQKQQGVIQHHWHDQSLGLHQGTIISLKGNVKVSKGVKTVSGPVLTQLDLLMTVEAESLMGQLHSRSDRK